MRRPEIRPTITTTAVSAAAGLAAGLLIAKRSRRTVRSPKPTLPDDPAWHAAVHGDHPPRVD